MLNQFGKIIRPGFSEQHVHLAHHSHVSQ